MCALLSAMRKIPIDPAPGVFPALGSAGQPAYSVSVTAEEAQAANAKWNTDRAAKKMVVPDPVPVDEADKTTSTGLEILPSLQRGFHGIADIQDPGSLGMQRMDHAAASVLFGRKPHTHQQH